MLATGLTACGGPDEVPFDISDLSPADAKACAAFDDALPSTLADQPRSDGDPDDDLPVTVYGDPPISVVCGVAEPDGFGPGASCEVANRSRWYIPADQYGDSPVEITLTAAWSRPRVQVVIPEDYWPSATAAVMAELAPLVRKLRTVGGRCL